MKARQMKTFWILLVLLCFDQARADYRRIYLEALTRTAVYHQAISKCGDRWGIARIAKLKVNLKESTGQAANHIHKSERDAITVDPAEVAAITSHLCESGRFPSNLFNEMSWYIENPTAAYVNKEESDTTNELGRVDASSADMESEYLADMPYTSKTSSFLMQPYASFIVGLVLGICLTHYVSLLKGGSSVGNVVSANKVRRPEL